ncbi:MAG: hypothetical protein ACI97N_001474 [Cognaticolwellia sp.]|jgi:uncharacterized protein YwqG
MSALKEAMGILEPFKRIAYFPQIEIVKSEFSAVSKFGGFPYLRHEDDWPICPNCQKNQQLFLQLNLVDLPERKGEGLIQLFYCTSNLGCESSLGGYLPFSKVSTCRKIKIEGESAIIELEMDSVFEEKRIKDWEAKADYPHREEYLDLEIDLTDEQIEAIEEAEMMMTLHGDKLFGYPFWVQSVEYPQDSNTGETMQLLFQIDSDDNLPYMFGDMGIGHLTQSPSNAEVLGFGWACY